MYFYEEKSRTRANGYFDFFDDGPEGMEELRGFEEDLGVDWAD